MNTLRKLLAEFGRYADDNDGSVDALAYDDCATQLSSAIPAWERLEKAAEAFRDAYDAGAEFNETEARNHYRAFSEALEGVKAK